MHPSHNLANDARSVTMRAKPTWPSPVHPSKRGELLD
jgi:hypothetical protein